MFITSGFLFFEYRFFCSQTQKMIDLKQEYRASVQTMQKILDDYHYLALQACKSNSLKKNAEQDAFVVINRQSADLKKSTLDFLRDNDLEGLVDRIDFDQWDDYAECMIMQLNNEENKKKAAQARRKTHSRKPPSNKTRIMRDITFAWPIAQSRFWLSSFFGPRKKANGSWGFHHGIDMAALKGTPVKAAADGVVIQARYASGYGKTILIQHNKKYKTRYAHLDKILVKRGSKIKRGQLIGKVGDTGFVRKSGKDASHLHFEVHLFGKQINPISFLV